MRKAVIAAATSLTVLFAMGTGNAHAEEPTTLVSVVDSVYGTPYKYGGVTTAGFDCSGFTRYVFKKLGIDLARVSSAQYKQGTVVSKSQLQAGDLVFFDTSGNGRVSHVGIYLGDQEFAHSSSSDGIKIDSLDDSYYKKRYIGAKRILSKYTYAKYAAES